MVDCFLVGLAKAEIQAKPETANPLSEYAEDIKAFAWEVFGIKLYSQQAKIVAAILIYRRVFVKSGHSVGKTAVAAVITDFVFSVLGDAVLTSAPSREQVKTLLWKQIAINRAQAQEIGHRKLPGDLLMGTPELRVPGKPDWWALGFFTDKPERAQGKKHPRMFVILDEMAGLPAWFIDSIDSSMATKACRMLGIGNPIHAQGPFYDKFTADRAGVCCLTISVTDSPNVTKAQAWEIYERVIQICPRTAEEIRPQIEAKVDEEPIEGLCDADWIFEKLEEWADDINKIRTRLFGLFPSDETSKVIPLPSIESAQALWQELEQEEEDYLEAPKVHCAYLDAAAEGPDYSVLAYQRGQRAHIAFVTNEPKTDKTAEMVFEWLASLEDNDRPRWIGIDIANAGKGIYDSLVTLKSKHPGIFGRTQIIPHHPGNRADDTKQFILSFAENYWRLRLALKLTLERQERLALPPEDRIPFVERRLSDVTDTGAPRKRKEFSIIAELNARTYYEDNRERTMVEGKPALLKRGIKSPDIADAIAGLMLRPKIVCIVS